MPNQRGKKYLLFGIFLAFLFAAYKGCEMFPESSFQLASDSRLPKWIIVPPGNARADVSLTMNYYSWPLLSDARFILRDGNGRIIQKKNGRTKCRFELENPPLGSPDGYPFYQTITVDGITEIIEHKKMEPIFYVTDDPVIRKLIESTSCSSEIVRLKN